MKRRQALKVLGAATALPVLGQMSADDLYALGARVRSGATPKPVTGQLTYLNAHQNATVTAIADLILPRTETPGAADVGVNEFIDLIVGGWYGNRDRGDFMVGLMRIDEMAQARARRDFVDLDVDDQVALLTELEAESFALKDVQEAAEAEARGPGPYVFPTEDEPDARTVGAPPRPEPDPSEKPWRDHIFQRLKYLTLYGYYTSEPGMMEELHFVMIPGTFQGCVPYEELHPHPPAGEDEAVPDTTGGAAPADTTGAPVGGHVHG